MNTRTIKTYSFSELSPEAQEKVIEKLCDINVNFDWWEYIYEDAERIGLKITSFDDYEATGYFLASAEETAHKIEKEHGQTTETYNAAAEYLKNRDETIEQAERDENGDFVAEYELDEELDKLDTEFLHFLLEDYRTILNQEYEYLTSRGGIIESIEAYEYEFTEDGKIWR